MPQPSSNRMDLVKTLEILREARKDEIVVTMMSVAREWIKLGKHPLDFVYVPSSMGQASSIGLGIALARPDKKVIACNGDGSMLMNLGSLATITAQAPENLVLLIFENGVYEVTGSQPTPGSHTSRKDREDVDFAGAARSCGFDSVFEFNDLETWRAQLPAVLKAKGPTCVVLHVAPIPGGLPPIPPGPNKQRALDFAATLAADR